MPPIAFDNSRGLRDAGAAALFQTDWQIYRKMVDNNFLFHSEAYAELHEQLLARKEPFDFLDIACGDAGSSAAALKGTLVNRYRGVDLSRPALNLAAEALRALGCEFTLVEGDYVEELNKPGQSTDIAWIGLSLHHFTALGKLAIMSQIRRLLADGGVLLIFENTSPDGEDRDSWLQRWDTQREAWGAYSDAEWNSMRDHVHASDYPETVSGWRELGREAGFQRTTELFRTPTDLFRLYCFE